MDATIMSSSQTAAEAHAALAQALRSSTVHVRVGRAGGGSGVIWKPDGTIVTNAHVAHGRKLAIELADGAAHDAELVARDERRDLAALRIDAHGLDAAAIGDSDAVRAGQLVFAVGNPMGLTGAVTSGVLFASGSRARWIQADVRIAPGNSGGPLADASGRVIGINSMIYGGLAIAVPSNAVTRFLKSEGGRPRLGVTVEPVQVRVSDRAAALGLLVFEVAAGSPADRAGILPGDAIVAVGGQPLRAEEDLLDGLADCGDDGELRLTIHRAGRMRDISVTFSTAMRRRANAAA
ncbi:MAG: trypsin-like peptidase domain-containing protein [Candidatus Eremiobacteraeota bacterium]|nr:trypsin-like peptidase domain-containing protein [Candidatus Eremiobacteraeota bacterium]MBV8221852.1 trypsin-like peptidase domain-containing protein [Candidatus Eremiobacteraeota bacterium]